MGVNKYHVLLSFKWRRLDVYPSYITRLQKHEHTGRANYKPHKTLKLQSYLSQNRLKVGGGKGACSSVVSVLLKTTYFAGAWQSCHKVYKSLSQTSALKFQTSMCHPPYANTNWRVQWGLLRHSRFSGCSIFKQTRTFISWTLKLLDHLPASI